MDSKPNLDSRQTPLFLIGARSDQRAGFILSRRGYSIPHCELAKPKNSALLAHELVGEVNNSAF
jgi:hypothetical protein